MKKMRIELDNEFEADVFISILEEENIPYILTTNNSFPYDGLFKMTLGWGQIEVPKDQQERAMELFEKYKESLSE
ncbi:MAG: hypothetical protein WCI30_07095 [Clostridia bacterium]